MLRSTEQTVDGRWAIEKPARRKLSEGERDFARLQKGDLLLTKSSGSALHIGKTTLVDDSVARMEACYSNFMQRLRVRSSLVPKLCWYILNNSIARSQFDNLSNTTTGLANLNGSMIGELMIPVAPLDQQADIVQFLDRETAKIDALVAEQEKLIELMKEKRQAVISHAVTKGLDQRAPMKDSEIDWLAKVPAHWEVRKLSTVIDKITNGYVGPTRDILVDQGVRYLQSLHIKENRIKFDHPYFVSEAWSLDHEKSILKAGDVLIVQTGDIGQVAVVTEEFAGCNCHALIIVSPAHTILSGEWLSWVLNSEYGFHSLLAMQTGALHPHLNCGNVRDIYVPVPPLAEQHAIVRDIEQRLSRLTELSDAAEHAISLLKERRSALISAAVTGKIDVRGLVGAEAA